MLLSKLGIAQGSTEWSTSKHTSLIRKCSRNSQRHQQRQHRSSPTTKHQRHYSYYHHHHRIAVDGDDGDDDGIDVMVPHIPLSGSLTSSHTTSWTTFVVIVTIFIAILHCQTANGAYTGNSYRNNNNNNSDSFNSVYSNNNASTAVDFMDDDFDSASFIQNLNKLRRQPIYQNEFAVYVPKGLDVADSVAAKFGFTNMGQVSQRVR